MTKCSVCGKEIPPGWGKQSCYKVVCGEIICGVCEELQDIQVFDGGYIDG